MCVCVCVFVCLQYENQVNILGTWTNKGPTMSRPKFSDSEGKVSLPVIFSCISLFHGILSSSAWGRCVCVCVCVLCLHMCRHTYMRVCVSASMPASCVCLSICSVSVLKREVGVVMWQPCLMHLGVVGRLSFPKTNLWCQKVGGGMETGTSAQSSGWSCISVNSHLRVCR